jgi:hypothetical protein
MLAEIYGWFSGGFDTADLSDAKDPPRRASRIDAVAVREV